MNTLNPTLNPKPVLQAQGRDFGIFVMEQSPRLRFNRGLLLNAGVLVLAGSDYDYFVFHDVDTIPTESGSIPYNYPAGSPFIQINARTCIRFHPHVFHTSIAPNQLASAS